METTKNKTRQTLYLIVGLLVAVGVLIALGRSSSGADQGGGVGVPSNPQNKPTLTQTGKLVAKDAYYDFGAVSMANGKVSRTFVFTNISDRSVAVHKLYTSCMCTVATLLYNGERVGPFGMPGHGFIPPIDKIIAPGASVELEVTFDPAAHGPAGVGAIQRVVTVEEQEGETLSVAQVGFSAVVTP